MIRSLLLTTVACGLLVGCAGTPDSDIALQSPSQSVVTEAPEETTPPIFPQRPSAEEAKSYVEEAEKTLGDLSEFAARTAWVRANFITFDTEWLEARANAHATETSVKLAMGAARFNETDADPVTRRKLNLLRLSLVLPAAQKEGAAQELATLATKLDSTYSTATFKHKNKSYNLIDASNVLAQSRNPLETKAMWEGWMATALAQKSDYERMIELSNDGAKGLGFKDAGSMWRSNYDMDPDAFAAETDRLWSQVSPLYKNLHCYARRKLNDKYGDAVQPDKGPIRADLMGNMWAQDWSNIYDLMVPKASKASYSLDQLLKSKAYTPLKMVQTGEAFYTSIGLAPLPKTFYERSLITKPKDREVVCHASAWDLDNRDDIRIKMCTQVNAEDFYTVHHELGHNVYQRAYKEKPFLFKNGAHDGFHEAIGDFVGLSSVTPTYLKQIGLLKTEPAPSEDMGYLLNMALQKVAFLPFGLMVDRWRWDVYSGKVSQDQYNDHWWKLIGQYQGLVPPGVRPSNAFDPGAKYHVPASVPYTRYFLAHILQFQFHKAACDQAGWTGPLHRCSIYNNKAVGAKFNAMMEMGQSKPWPDALEAFTGKREMDGSAVVEYFAPLQAWLTEQNSGQDCGW
jgi:peptidyl-dipeptidase A